MRAEPDRTWESPEVPEALWDVQRLVLKGYPATHALHVGLTVRDARGARAFLGRLGAPGGAPGTVTTAAEWHRTPGFCLTVGITFEGLRALGVSEEHLSTFPAEFREGAVRRARVVGEEGPSRSETWLPWLRGAAGGDLHVLLTVLATDAAGIDEAADLLRQDWSPSCREVGRFRAEALLGRDDLAPSEEEPPSPGGGGPDGSAVRPEPKPRFLRVHFGYRDGFSQPTLQGLPQIGLVDPLEQVPVGALVLGHELHGADLPYRYRVPEPDVLGRNGSFAAFRILEQDVPAFEGFLEQQARETGDSKELVAAKLCGRWRDGTPLALRPDDTSPSVPEDRFNDFDYAGQGADGAAADPDGVRCPLGAHIRRMNPRGTDVAGAPDVRRFRRLVRRGMTYGPEYVGEGRDDESRGLVGLFIGASLRDSFEFLLREWAHDGAFSPTLGRTQDPLLGSHDRPGTTTFVVPGETERTLHGLPRLVTTRGGAYLFLPSATALRHLGETPPENRAAAVPVTERLAALSPGVSALASPRRPRRRAEDPQWRLLIEEFTHRRGALLRELVEAESSRVLVTPAAVVVTGHDAVRTVLGDDETFSVAPYRKAMVTVNRGPNFVLGMDPGREFDRHRRLLEGVLMREDVDRAREHLRAGAAALLAVPGPLDVVAYAKALAARVAADVLGLRGLGSARLAGLCHAVFLGLFVNLDEDPELESRAVTAREELREHIVGLVRACPATGPLPDDVLGRLVTAVGDEGEVADQLIGLVVGLVDNVVAGICSALDELLGRPRALALAERAATAGDDSEVAQLVYEVLRFAPPAPLLLRQATRSHHLAGVLVPEGTLVLAVTAAAMLDGSAFPDPEEVRPDRPLDTYLHFGAGTHRCLGRALGGTVVVEGVRALLHAGLGAATVPVPLKRAGDTPVRYVVQLPGVLPAQGDAVRRVRGLPGAGRPVGIV